MRNRAQRTTTATAGARTAHRPGSQPAAICLPTTDGALAGRYHHHDGHPAALGVTLLRLHTAVFAGDLQQMAAVLLAAHPAGWVSLVHPTTGRLFNQPDLTDPTRTTQTDRPRCYCHGGWPGTTHTITCTSPNCTGSGCTPGRIHWIYALHPDHITVHHTHPSTSLHRPIAHVPWDAVARMRTLATTSRR